MYFPTEKMIYKDARDREIVSEYNGFNHKEFGGTSVYFHTEKMIYKEATHLINIGMCSFLNFIY